MALASTSTWDPFFDWNVNAFPTDLGVTGGWPGGGDVSHRIPRHVASRVLYTNDGDVIWRPAADVFETDDAIVVHVDLPGVPKDEINIEVSGNQLIIHGEHKGVKGFESATSRVRERNIGRFRKIINLPAGVDTDKIQAKYENGLLEVKIPKSQEMKGKQIAIQ
ncbi:uncharacterized protein SPPG_07775 [Spizellomyces punctatus DAOM BR117]|uniref:SHSP domain-containing protein n=1 Tax=Spizellomyces punctatus (strain DAOM BR117) TaxID=645134 RepID=A0A0L0H616_SPIPD|nr:uncharacterized protein SPPG_07775 [Spizellomyces punctatus DAOM BR117]KNC96955.1 hypothetical protein SPPG_07775 [Spizellomyces punctatus DAOM BR117]|eukprot:XP_016604995.1 hypothetical protein SPPG_07775 [Spizellomyces punctatus DAOM BR117]